LQVIYEGFGPNQEGSGILFEGTFMLVLTRKLGESIAIDDHIKIVVVQIKGKQVRLGIKAPKETKIHREEVYQAIQDQNTEASQSDLSSLSDLTSDLKKK
jgi:carbon storage regulator